MSEVNLRYSLGFHINQRTPPFYSLIFDIVNWHVVKKMEDEQAVEDHKADTPVCESHLLGNHLQSAVGIH